MKRKPDRMDVAYMIVTVVVAVGAAFAGTSEGVIETHLYALEREDVPRAGASVFGYEGAIEAIDNDLLLVRPKQGGGGIVLIRPNGDVETLAGEVPTNVSALQALPDDDAHRWVRNFRVTDILLNESTTGRFDLYVAHHYVDGECVRFRVSLTGVERIPVKPHHSDTTVRRKTRFRSSWETVFDAGLCLMPFSWLPLHQSAGKMLMDDPGHLLVMVGDYGQAGGPGGGTSPDELVPPFGALLRVTIATGETETLTRGHRNVQGMARDAAGNLWASEHGPRGGDELNLLELGRDYGWPKVSYGIGYNEPGGSLPPPLGGGGDDGEAPHWPERDAVGRHAGGYTAPVFAWVPSIAPTAIVPNDAQWFPMWGDDLLIASLRGGAIFRVRFLGGRVQYVEKIPFGARIRDLAWMPDGRLAVLHSRGRVSFLKRSDKYCSADSPRGGGAYAVHCED